jgi:hypothetical protein
MGRPPFDASSQNKQAELRSPHQREIRRAEPGKRRVTGRFAPILLQKSQKAQRRIFRQRTKQATIADQ